MKQKLTLLILALFTAMGAGAVDVVISDRTNTLADDQTTVTTTNEHKYGTYANAGGGISFTTNTTSGLAGLTLTTVNPIIRAYYFSSYKHGIGFNPTTTDEQILTITAPDGYYIIGYYITAVSTSSGRQFTVNGKNVSAPTEVAISSTNIYSKSTEIRFTAQTNNTGNWLCFKDFKVIVSKPITALSQLSNSKCYNIFNNRGIWAAGSGAESLTSTSSWTGGLNLKISSTDVKQRFAFINYDGKYYLYSVSEKKFAYVDGTKLSLSDLSSQAGAAPSEVTFFASTEETYKISSPVVIAFDGKSYGVHNKNPNIYQYSPHYDDGGNASSVSEAGDFDPSEALTKLKAYLDPSEGIYTFNILASDNATPQYLSTSTTQSVVKYAVKENGTNSNGRTVYSLQNVETGKYLSYTSTNKSTGGSDTPLSWADDDTSSKFVIQNGAGKVTVWPVEASSENYLTAWNRTLGSSFNVVFWTATNDLSYWTMTRVATYNLKWNGSTIHSSTREVLVGNSSADYVPWSVPAYSSFSYDVATIESETSTVNVTLNWNGPFEISSDYASAVWYYMKSNNMWAYYDSSDDTKIPVVSSIEDAYDKGDAALWAFVGNPCDGVQVINKAKGSGYFINFDNEVKMISSGYTITQIEDGGDNGFALNNTGYSIKSTSEKLVLAYDHDSARFLKVRSYYCQKALDDLVTYAEANAVGQYFGVRQESIDLLQGFFEAMPKMTETEYSTYSVPAGVAPYLSINYPSTGYYRIKNNGTGNYLAYGTPIVVGGTRPAGLIATSNNTDAASIIKLTGSKGTYKLTTQGLNIQSQTASNVTFPGSDAEGADFVFNVSTPGVVSITNAASADGNNGNKDGSLHEATTDDWTVHGVVNWSASNPNSKWVIEEATTFTVPLNGPVDGSYYATLCVPFDVTLDGATAYTLNLNAARTALTMTEVEGTVAAGTPVLLKGTSASATASISTPSSTAISTETALTGTYVAKAVTGSTDYFLGMANGKVGFYHWDGSTLSANRAYLEASKLNNSGVKGFALDFEDDATGINEELRMKNEESSIYNLAGQRMNKMQKGINIINGKKILK